MKMQGNGKRSSLALSMTCEECRILFKKGRKLVLGLSSLLCKLTILVANLKDLLILNTITWRFLTCEELQKRCMCDVP
jgi:hypothetical protein